MLHLMSMGNEEENLAELLVVLGPWCRAAASSGSHNLTISNNGPILIVRQWESAALPAELEISSLRNKSSKELFQMA